MLTKIDKALMAGASAAVLAFVTAQANGSDLPHAGVAAAGGFVVGFLTWWIPNKTASKPLG